MDALNDAARLVRAIRGPRVLAGGERVGNKLVELQLLQIGGRNGARRDGRNRLVSLR